MSWLTPDDPVGAGGIPLSNDLVAGLQLGAGLVQLLRQLPSHAGHRQGHGLPLCQSVQPLCHLLQTAAAPPAEGQTKCQDQHDQPDPCGQDAGDKPVDDIGVYVKVAFPQGARRLPE